MLERDHLLVDLLLLDFKHLQTLLDLLQRDLTVASEALLEQVQTGGELLHIHRSTVINYLEGLHRMSVSLLLVAVEGFESSIEDLYRQWLCLVEL